MVRPLIVICGLLLLANFTVFLWPTGAQTAAHVHSPRTDIKPHFIRLNKEIEDKFLLATPTRVIEDDMELAVGSGGQGCFRLGPFLHQANYELAQAVLFNADVKYQKSTRPSRKSDVFRVYLGPYSNKAAASDMRIDLKRNNVLDHFVRKEADNVFIVSLGIFTTQESAKDAKSLFDGMFELVKMKQESIVLPDSYWLHFDLEQGKIIRQQLARMDWGEQSAKLGRYQCLAV